MKRCWIKMERHTEYINGNSNVNPLVILGNDMKII